VYLLLDTNGYNLTTNALNVSSLNAVLDMQGVNTLARCFHLWMVQSVSGISNAIIFPGTVECNGTTGTQTVTTGSYFKLLFSGIGGVYTMGSNIDVANTSLLPKET
jgi:hypothetical protein